MTKSFMYTNDEIYAILKILFLIMEADGIIHTEELNYINNIMKEFNVSITDLDNIELIEFNDCKDVLAVMNQQKKRHARNLLLDLASADGCVDKCEISLLESLGL